MILGLGFLLGFIGFHKIMCLYIEVQKIDINTFSHILNFISLKRNSLCFLLKPHVLIKVDIFVTNFS